MYREPKQKLADEMVEAWAKFWKAGEELELALEEFQGSNIQDISNQRILQMKSKLYADRCDIEFSLNRLIEDEQVNRRDVGGTDDTNTTLIKDEKICWNRKHGLPCPYCKNKEES